MGQELARIQRLPWLDFVAYRMPRGHPTPGDTVPVDTASGSAVLAPPITHRQKQMGLFKGSVASSATLVLTVPRGSQRDSCPDSRTSMSEEWLVWARAVGVCTGPWEDGVCQVGPVPTPGCSTLHEALPAFGLRDSLYTQPQGCPLLPPGARDTLWTPPSLAHSICLHLRQPPCSDPMEVKVCSLAPPG